MEFALKIFTWWKKRNAEWKSLKTVNERTDLQDEWSASLWLAWIINEIRTASLLLGVVFFSSEPECQSRPIGAFLNWFALDNQLARTSLLLLIASLSFRALPTRVDFFTFCHQISNTKHKSRTVMIFTRSGGKRNKQNVQRETNSSIREPVLHAQQKVARGNNCLFWPWRGWWTIVEGRFLFCLNQNPRSL